MDRSTQYCHIVRPLNLIYIFNPIPPKVLRSDFVNVKITDFRILRSAKDPRIDNTEKANLTGLTLTKLNYKDPVIKIVWY